MREAPMRWALSEGTGPAVVMIPSLGRGAADFAGLSRTLAEAGFHAIRFQPRGTVADDRGLDGMTIGDEAADVAAVIEAFGAAPCVVIGHAYGQRVARLLTARRPDLVRGLIMLAAGGRVPPLDGAADALERCFQLDLPDAQRLDAIAQAFFAPGHDPSVWRDGWFPALQAAQRAGGRVVPVDAWWSAGDTVPILVIQGLDDTIAPPANGRALRDALADRVRLVELADAGHALLPEQPSAIAAEVLAFLRGGSGT